MVRILKGLACMGALLVMGSSNALAVKISVETQAQIVPLEKHTEHWMKTLTGDRFEEIQPLNSFYGTLTDDKVPSSFLKNIGPDTLVIVETSGMAQYKDFMFRCKTADQEAVMKEITGEDIPIDVLEEFKVLQPVVGSLPSVINELITKKRINVIGWTGFATNAKALENLGYTLYKSYEGVDEDVDLAEDDPLYMFARGILTLGFPDVGIVLTTFLGNRNPTPKQIVFLSPSDKESKCPCSFSEGMSKFAQSASIPILEVRCLENHEYNNEKRKLEGEALERAKFKIAEWNNSGTWFFDDQLDKIMEKTKTGKEGKAEVFSEQ